MSVLDGKGPIFVQIADRIADDIVAGVYPEHGAIPSINDFSVFFRTAPMTVGKAITQLVDQGVLYKKRGIGMFVAEGAPALLRERRAQALRTEFIAPLLREADLIGVDLPTLHQLIDQEASS
ncbi:GntR family transcriptional regulator [Cellulomonas denverensis]|uniref:GntR family transcriptional regulator n=1 Tax=Cellulomonas denverensis TaxID=264297 RepID=UPI001EF25DDC|nr:GntR family transcriptional regulator [Cellulomonas denverensis]